MHFERDGRRARTLCGNDAVRVDGADAVVRAGVGDEAVADHRNDRGRSAGGETDHVLADRADGFGTLEIDQVVQRAVQIAAAVLVNIGSLDRAFVVVHGVPDEQGNPIVRDRIARDDGDVVCGLAADHDPLGMLVQQKRDIVVESGLCRAFFDGIDADFHGLVADAAFGVGLLKPGPGTAVVAVACAVLVGPDVGAAARADHIGRGKGAASVVIRKAAVQHGDHRAHVAKPVLLVRKGSIIVRDLRARLGLLCLDRCDRGFEWVRRGGFRGGRKHGNEHKSKGQHRQSDRQNFFQKSVFHNEILR